VRKFNKRFNHILGTLIDREEKLHLISDKANNLELKAGRFGRSARKLKCMMILENFKMYLILLAILLVSYQLKWIIVIFIY
jgi:hypothetical protein